MNAVDVPAPGERRAYMFFELGGLLWLEFPNGRRARACEGGRTHGEQMEAGPSKAEVAAAAARWLNDRFGPPTPAPTVH